MRKRRLLVETDDSGEVRDIVIGQWLIVARTSGTEYFVSFTGANDKRTAFYVSVDESGVAKLVQPVDDDLTNPAP